VWPEARPSSCSPVLPCSSGPRWKKSANAVRPAAKGKAFFPRAPLASLALSPPPPEETNEDARENTQIAEKEISNDTRPALRARPLPLCCPTPAPMPLRLALFPMPSHHHHHHHHQRRGRQDYGNAPARRRRVMVGLCPAAQPGVVNASTLVRLIKRANGKSCHVLHTSAQPGCSGPGGGSWRQRHPPGQETERRGDRSRTANGSSTPMVSRSWRDVLCCRTTFYSPPLAAYGGG
jgi:hypothetical protein